MKILSNLTPRTILFISLGILAYIALASYHSSVKSNHPLPEQHAAMSHDQGEIARLQQRVSSYKQEIAAAREEETRLRNELTTAKSGASGKTVKNGAMGILMSLPELAFLNIRKGSYKHLLPPSKT